MLCDIISFRIIRLKILFIITCWCSRSNATGWTNTETWTLICEYGGPCFSEQEYDWCVGKDNRRPVGDGTWCYNDKRRTKCDTIIERGIRSSYHFVKTSFFLMTAIPYTRKNL